MKILQKINCNNGYGYADKYEEIRSDIVLRYKIHIKPKNYFDMIWNIEKQAQFIENDKLRIINKGDIFREAKRIYN